MNYHLTSYIDSHIVLIGPIRLDMNWNFASRLYVENDQTDGISRT
jgi:hypothetical protein